MKKPKGTMWDLPTNVKGSYDHYYKVKDYNDLCTKPSYGPCKDYWELEEKEDSLKNGLYDDWIYDTYPYNSNSTNIHEKQSEDAALVKRLWLGALVQFSMPYYPRAYQGMVDFPDLIVTPTTVPHSPDQSRKVHADNNTRPTHMGTVIDVDSKPGYRNQWRVRILWSDGVISYENILDLEIVQPGPG